MIATFAALKSKACRLSSTDMLEFKHRSYRSTGVREGPILLFANAVWYQANLALNGRSLHQLKKRFFPDVADIPF